MKQVVIVDDEPDLLLSIRAGFERNDRFQLMTAANGMEALDILDNNVVDLVVTDLQNAENGRGGTPCRHESVLSGGPKYCHDGLWHFEPGTTAEKGRNTEPPGKTSRYRNP